MSRDLRFGNPTKCIFTVPVDYDHNTWLDTFAEQTKAMSTPPYFDEELTSANFAKATNQFVPGKTYEALFFPVLVMSTPHQYCVEFLLRQGIMLGNAHGLTLLCANMPEAFPAVKYTVSLDEENSLWKDPNGYHRVPGVYRDGNRCFSRFELELFEIKHESCSDICILGFREV
jgi:hypothetical protein